MALSFKSILIPVDLSINTEVAIKKGIELADKEATLHLLYVKSSSLKDFITATGRYVVKAVEPAWTQAGIEQKLHQLKARIEDCNSNISVCIWIEPAGAIQKSIEGTAKALQPDLIIIGKNADHSWFPFLNTVTPAKIAQKTGIPVLTVKPGSIYNKVRTMIVPIANEMTKQKVDLIAIICRKFRVKVHLVTFINEKNNPSDFNPSSLLEVYHWLKISVNCEVDYAVLHGQNKAKVILNYAEKINADMLLVHPNTETKIGWLNGHIPDVLPPGSKIEVLSIRSPGSYF